MGNKLTQSKVLENLENCSNMFLKFDQLFYITFKLVPECGTIAEKDIIRWLYENTALNHPWEIDGAFIAILATQYLGCYNMEGSNKFHLTTKGRRAKHAISG